MAELTELEVDRVDGVDKPATRRKFVLMKSADPPDGDAGESGDEEEPVAKDADSLHGAARRALAAMSGVSLTKAQAEALNTLAAACGQKAAFKAMPHDDEDDEHDKDGKKRRKDGPDEAAGMLKAEELAAAVAKALAEPLGAIAKALDRGEVRKAADPPPSTQPRGKEEVSKGAEDRKIGQGLFRSILS